MKFGGTLGRNPDPHSVGGGAAAGVDSDFVVRFSTVISSSISTRTGSVQLSIAGIAGLDYEGGTIDPSDVSKAQGTDDAEQFSAPGVMCRPLPPRNINGVDQHMDVLALVTADGLVPFAYRDLRIKMGGNAPGEGVVAFVGYGNSFYSITPVEQGGDPAGGGAIHTIYCPFDFNANGVAQKAHTIMIDPTPGNESVLIAHADGLAISMFDNALVMKNASGNATFRLDDDGITLTATNIILSGGVIVGNPATAVALAAGAASPPSTVFYVSPTP